MNNRIGGVNLCSRSLLQSVFDCRNSFMKKTACFHNSKSFLSILLFSLFVSAGCTQRKAELGTEKNPIKFFLVPSVDAKLLSSQGQQIKAYLESATPYKFLISVPTSYIAVVEAFGSHRADISSINTFGYILANERFGAEARLTVVRRDRNTYQSMIVVRDDSPIRKVEDLNNKKFAFVDPASGSGYIVPQKFLKDKNIKLKESVFAQKHDNVVMMVHQGQVDAGAAYYSPPHEGVIEDARRLLLKAYPNIEKEIRILTLTDPVPNDPIIFRKDVPEEIKKAVTDALFQYVKTKEGREVFFSIYGATDLVTANDKTYDGFRAMLKEVGVNTSTLVK
jgi:phosphonate transport system substrate-binding protein